ncbi:MAG: tetratricopeptide repeat protein [Desulfobacter sp.]|nr:MAG: tetratricopeptide repeat protein [Desulfobacter sp.]
MQKTKQDPTQSGQWIKDKIIEFKNKGQFAAMIQWLDKRLADPELDDRSLQAKLYNELGLAHLAQDRPEKVRTCYEKALALVPDHVNALYNLANLDLGSGFYTAALDRFSKVLDLAPDHAGALYNSALCHALEGRIRVALPLFVRVTQINPLYMSAFYWAGECQLNLKNYDSALGCFERSAELDPDHPESARGLAICQLKTGAPGAALKTCQDLLNKTGPDPTVLKVMGDALLAQGQAEAAALCHLDMVFLDLDAKAFLVSRAKALFEKNPKTAKQYTQRIIDDLPELASAMAPIVTDEIKPETPVLPA